MPDAVKVSTKDGNAVVEFADPAVRGRGVATLIEKVGAENVRPVTRPVKAYVVPEDVARAAGILDGIDLSSTSEPADPKGYDDGLPDSDWSRPALNEYAAKLDPPLNPADYSNKELLLDAIKTAVEAGAKRPEAPAPA